jgi:hypothetical protein
MHSDAAKPDARLCLAPNVHQMHIWQKATRISSANRDWEPTVGFLPAWAIPIAQYAASLRIASAIFSGLTMNQSSSTWLYGTPGTSGPAIRVTGPSR